NQNVVVGSIAQTGHAAEGPSKLSRCDPADGTVVCETEMMRASTVDPDVEVDDGVRVRHMADTAGTHGSTLEQNMSRRWVQDGRSGLVDDGRGAQPGRADDQPGGGGGPRRDRDGGPPAARDAALGATRPGYRCLPPGAHEDVPSLRPRGRRDRQP